MYYLCSRPPIGGGECAAAGFAALRLRSVNACVELQSAFSRCRRHVPENADIAFIKIILIRSI